MRLSIYPYDPARQTPGDEDERRAVVSQWRVDEPHRVPPQRPRPSRAHLDQGFCQRCLLKKPEPTGSIIVLELNEMWHYLKKNVTSSRSGKRSIGTRGSYWTGSVGGVIR